MGRRLSDEERAHRIVNKVHVRTLSSHGRCKLCKEKIKRGEKSLRYFDIVYGRKQEVGICLQCADKLWEHAEDAAAQVSAEIQKYREERDNVPSPAPPPNASTPQVDPPEEPPKACLVMPTIPDEAVPDQILAYSQERIEQLEANRRDLMNEMFGEDPEEKPGEKC